MPASEPGCFLLFGRAEGSAAAPGAFGSEWETFTHPLLTLSPHPKARRGFQRARTKGAGLCPTSPPGTAGERRLERSESLRKKPGGQDSAPAPPPAPGRSPADKGSAGSPAPSSLTTRSWRRPPARCSCRGARRRGPASARSWWAAGGSAGAAPAEAAAGTGHPAEKRRGAALKRGPSAAGGRRAPPGCRPLPAAPSPPRPRRSPQDPPPAAAASRGLLRQPCLPLSLPRPPGKGLCCRGFATADGASLRPALGRWGGKEKRRAAAALRDAAPGLAAADALPPVRRSRRGPPEPRWESRGRRCAGSRRGTSKRRPGLAAFVMQGWLGSQLPPPQIGLQKGPAPQALRGSARLPVTNADRAGTRA